jgi:hypothetical protein
VALQFSLQALYLFLLGLDIFAGVNVLGHGFLTIRQIELSPFLTGRGVDST